MSKKGDRWIKHTHVFETTEDPYAIKEAPAGEAICPRCKAVFKDKRWVIDEDLYEELKEVDTVPQLICPGCKKAIEQYAMGYLYISGGFWESHRGDIMKLLNNEYERARNINPLHQIININEEDGTTIIETTTDHLAQRLGRALYRAYKGDLEFRWSKGDKLVRVYWHRDK